MRRNRNDAFDAAALVIISAAAVFLFVSALCASPGRGNSSAWQAQGDEPVVRLHVRAAGDSETEQRFKMDLVAQVQRLLAEKCLPGENSYEAYLSLLAGYLPELQASLQKYAVDAGAGADISLHLGSEYFPIRTYGRRFYPAGEYTALVINIDEGEGENWWCLLFPALCLPLVDVDNRPEDYDREEYLSHEETLYRTSAEEANGSRDRGGAEEAGGSGGTVRWRIKLWDLVKRPGQQIIEKAGRIFYN